MVEGRLDRRGRRRGAGTRASLLVPLVVLITLGTATSAAVADHDGLHLPVTDLLPPLVPAEPAADRAEDCGDDGLACLRYVEGQLAAWEAHFGCDHRAVFPTVYRLLTSEAIATIEADPASFDDAAGFGYEALVFYEMFDEMMVAHLAGEPIAPAWRVAMDVATRGDHTGGHDMLLAINAHVQRDMPFALEATGLALPDGRSRKPDHDAMNAVLSRAYDTIVQEIGERYDPVMLVIDGDHPVDDLGANLLVQVWREGVWRNAERLVHGAERPWRPTTVRTIELQAVLTARLLSVGEVPGHRAARLAYCLRQAEARGEPTDGSTALDGR